MRCGVCAREATWQRGSNDLAIFACDDHGPTAVDQTGWRHTEGSAEMTYETEEVDQQLLDRLDKSLTNHSPDREQVERIEAIRDAGKDLAKVIASYCADSRERNLAATHLEETVMWAVKSIVLEDSISIRQ